MTFGTVVLVEDEADVAEVAAEMLREQGFTVLTAETGEDALRLLRLTSSIDLLITDIMMPGLNGYEVAHRAKAIQPSVRILYFTGYDDDAQMMAEAVHGPVLQKPFVTAQLIDAVKSALAQR
jgi:two-component system cell cycle sensor histidine kinase/response regulator CckA